MTSLHETEIPGGWKEESVEIAGRRFELLLPADPDQFLDFMTQSGNHPSWPDPYWAKLWPMSMELARLILIGVAGVERSEPPETSSGGHSINPRLKNTATTQNNWGLAALDPSHPITIIEIGCGVGMAGLAALARGWDVTFSDYIPLAMDLAVDNARRNGLPEAKKLWLDWRDPPQLAFDVVLASEVLYDRTLHPAILQTLDAILAPHGRAWFADPGRTATEEFIPRAKVAGWQVGIIDREGKSHEQLQFNQFNRLELMRDSS